MDLNRKGNGKPRVYMVDSIGEHRGMHYYNFSLVSELNELDAKVVLISTPKTANHPLRPKTVPAWGGFRGIYGDLPKWMRGMNYAVSLTRIFLWAMRDKPKITHFHFFQIPPLDYLFLRGLKSLGIRIIATVHDVLPFHLGSNISSPQGKMYARLYSTCTGLIVNSRQARETLSEIDSGLLKKTILIPHGGFSIIGDKLQNHYTINPKKAKLSLELDPSEPTILVFGTIKANKRLDMAIKAMKKVLPRFPNAKLLIVGKPQDRDVSKDIELAEQLGLSTNIRWRLERVSDQELFWYFSAADVVLFPYQWIYQSGAILMAMSLSKPIIATAVGNNKETINDHETGILVPLDNVDYLSDAIVELLSDPIKSKQMGIAAHKHVTVDLSWNNIAKLTQSFYDEIVPDYGV